MNHLHLNIKAIFYFQLFADIFIGKMADLRGKSFRTQPGFSFSFYLTTHLYKERINFEIRQKSYFLKIILLS